MKTISLIQGTPEWHAHRATHFNASDAPAMMGCGLKSRSELLAELYTAIKPEVSQFVQERVFDPGHRFEALARPLAEKIIGEDLYAVTGTNGIYSASFDGLTMLEEVAFEHKRLNDDLRACFDDMETMSPEYRETGSAGRLLPLMYQVQMEHQALVSECKRVLFMASEWDDEDKLIAERHCWYIPNPELRAKIIAGWKQLKADLAVYKPAPQADHAPVGKKPESLPALRIEVTGAVTASNLAAFKETALNAIRAVKRELSTDQDFADADASVKWCADVESRLAAAKEHALSQTASIDALFKAIDDISAETRKVRLDLEKLVKGRKDQIRMEIVSEAVAKGNEHIRTLNERIGKPLMPTIPADYAGVIKNKRTLASLRDSVDTELARFKIAANDLADRIEVNIKTLKGEAHDWAFLFPDLASVASKPAEDFANLLSARIAAHNQAEDARKAREDAAAAQAAQVVHPAVQAVVIPPVSTMAQELAAPVANATNVPLIKGELGAIDGGFRFVETEARIKLGDINAMLAPIQITADGLAQLGIASVGKERSSVLYRASDRARICAALVQHIHSVSTPAVKAA